MLFPSYTFILFFLPVTLGLYYLFGMKNRTVAHIWLVLASFVFYSWFNTWYFLILVVSILLNWGFAQCLMRWKSKLIFIAGILCNVLILGYFKYYDFFVENLNMFFGTSFLLKHILCRAQM